MYFTQEGAKGVDTTGMSTDTKLTLALPLCELLRFLWVPNTGANTSTDDTCIAAILSPIF